MKDAVKTFFLAVAVGCRRKNQRDMWLAFKAVEFDGVPPNFLEAMCIVNIDPLAAIELTVGIITESCPSSCASITC